MSNKKNSTNGNGYTWATWGDLNAFFGLMIDNITNLIILSGILIGVFNYPADIVYQKMIPGTALGVLVGDLVYTWLAFRLAKQKGLKNVTAMPLGLDTPSTIGIAFAVLGPAYLATKDPILTWYIGMATMIFIGIIKVIFSFLGSWVQRVVPQAGLLGSIAGIGLALLAFLPLLEIFKLPIVGLVALGLILYTLIARQELPFKIPGAFAAVIVGTVIYFICAKTGLLPPGEVKPINFNLHFALPLPSMGFLDGMKEALKYLPLAIPFGLLTIVGGINVTESARVAGDDYKTQDILLTEAIATLVAGLFGGVAQSTPYIGHPAYKHMGARAAYTLATGLFIGLGGILGYISIVLQLIPQAAAVPIFIFVGLEIITQAYHACSKEHTAAVSFAFLPIVANLVLIKVNGFLGNVGVNITNITEKLGHNYIEYEVLAALGHGFILTAMLWGAVMAFIIDRKLKQAALYLVVTAFFTFFGIIHSVTYNGDIYLPWTLTSYLPYHMTAGYLILALFFLAMSFKKEESFTQQEENIKKD